MYLFEGFRNGSVGFAALSGLLVAFSGLNTWKTSTPERAGGLPCEKIAEKAGRFERRIRFFSVAFHGWF